MENYRFTDTDIGSGSYGTVGEAKTVRSFRTARHTFKRGERVAIKTFGDLLSADAIREIDILNRVNHPNVVGAYDTFSVDNCEGLAVVMPLARDNLGKVDKRMVNKGHLLQIACGLAYLHKNFIIHEDVKPENILIFPKGGSRDDFVPKIADFGLSNIIEGHEDEFYAVSQTMLYRPPEILLDGDDNVSSYHSYETDVWALGVVFYEMVSGTNPFLDPRGVDYERYLMTAMENFGGNEDFTDRSFTTGRFSGIDELLRGMLNVNPAERFTMDDVLGSPFFAGMECDLPRMETIPSSPPKELSARNRTTIVEWMKELTLDLGEYPNGQNNERAFFLSVDLFDRFMSTQESEEVHISKRQAVAVACVFLASQLLDHTAADLEYYAYVTAGAADEREVADYSCIVMEALGWRLFRPTMQLIFPEADLNKLVECIEKYPSPNEIRDCVDPPTTLTWIRRSIFG